MRHFNTSSAPAARFGGAFTLTVAALLGGCAAFDTDAEWRHGKVVQLVTQDAAAKVPADDRCLGRVDAQAVGDHPTVAIVRYRVTRAYFRQAFLQPKDMTLAVGDAVMVTPDGCELARRVAAGNATPTP